MIEQHPDGTVTLDPSLLPIDEPIPFVFMGEPMVVVRRRDDALDFYAALGEEESTPQP